MPVRDARVVEAVTRQPFAGYAVHRRVAWDVDVDRVAACVLILGSMVLSGIALGSPRGVRVK